MREFGEEDAGEVGDARVTVLEADGHLADRALDLNHVVEDEVRQHEQRRLAHAAVRVAQPRVEVRRPRLEYVGETRGEVAERHHDVGARGGDFGLLQRRKEQREVRFAEGDADAHELAQSQGGRRLQAGRVRVRRRANSRGHGRVAAKQRGRSGAGRGHRRRAREQLEVGDAQHQLGVVVVGAGAANAHVAIGAVGRLGGRLFLPAAAVAAILVGVAATAVFFERAAALQLHFRVVEMDQLLQGDVARRKEQPLQEHGRGRTTGS